MHKNSQKKQEPNYPKDVLDIIQYGSSTIQGKEPKDIDIAVIFRKIPLSEQLEHAQQIKKRLEKRYSAPIHVKAYDFYTLLDPSNFAREGILFNGKSIITKKPLAEMLGLKPAIQIQYSLVKLAKKDKIRFHYLLQGKKGKYGILRKNKGKLIRPGLIEIPPEHEEQTISKIKRITNDYIVQRIFRQTE